MKYVTFLLATTCLGCSLMQAHARLGGRVEVQGWNPRTHIRPGTPHPHGKNWEKNLSKNPQDPNFFDEQDESVGGYNPYKQNKFGDPNRVKARYYNGEYLGRFDEQEYHQNPFYHDVHN